MSRNSRFKQFLFNVDASMGYYGAKSTIRIMSSYEWRAIQFIIQLYKAGRIKKWASEESIFEYSTPLDPPDKTHRYFMDFTIEMANGDMIFIEVKPYSQHAIPPKMKGRKKDSTYQEEVRSWIVNQSKWSAVKDFCLRESTERKKYKFVIWDEYTLKLK